jgi:hypothetical protein
MPLSPEELYLQLGNLVADMRDLAHAPITPEMNRWLGRACALIDPFADIDIVEYAMHAPSEVSVQVLADAKKHKDTLKPAVEKWALQFQGKRPPLEVRLAPVNTLHDRLIIVDGVVWDLGQSFNQLAKSAPTSFERSDGDTAREKWSGT